METYQMKAKYLNLLAHAVWLKSNNQTTAENAHTLSKLMSKIEFLDSRSIAMSTVEKIIYHYVNIHQKGGSYVYFISTRLF